MRITAAALLFFVLCACCINHVSSMSMIRRGRVAHHHLLSDSEMVSSSLSSDSESESSAGVIVDFTCTAVDPASAYSNQLHQDIVSQACGGKDALQGAYTFWEYGHAGHYPSKEREERNKDNVARYLCTATGATKPSVVAIEKNDLKLDLVCLHPDYRRTDGMAVGLLNAALNLKRGSPVTWISSTTPNTVNFYKSLTIDCECADVGTSTHGGAAKVWQFKGKPNVAKKTRYYVYDADDDSLQRVFPDICMQADEFTPMMTALVSKGFVVERSGPHANTNIDNENNVKLSDLVRRARLQKPISPALRDFEKPIIKCKK